MLVCADPPAFCTDEPISKESTGKRRCKYQRVDNVRVLCWLLLGLHRLNSAQDGRGTDHTQDAQHGLLQHNGTRRTPAQRVQTDRRKEGRKEKAVNLATRDSTMHGFGDKFKFNGPLSGPPCGCTAAPHFITSCRQGPPDPP